MKRNLITSILIILSVLTILLYLLASTYGIIVSVVEEDGIVELLDNFTIRDLLTNSNGEYNQLYYDIKNEINLTYEEAEILIDSTPVNERYHEVLNDIAKYKLNNTGEKIVNSSLQNIINNAILDTDGLSDDTKSNIINKSKEYIDDISRYIYDIEFSIK